MKIDLTKEDYRNLLDMMSMATFVLDADLNQPQAILAGYKDLEQKLFSYASVFDADNLVEFFPDEGVSMPTLEFEQTSPCLAVMDDYNDYIFWEELVSRLAEQDMIREFGTAAVMDMPLPERLAREVEYGKPYWDEFEKRGLERLTVLPVD